MSEEKEVPKEEMVVAEQADGSATFEGVDIPESAEEKAEGGSVTAQSVPEDGGDDHPDDTDAIRSARRDKRKAKKVYQRQQQQEKDVRFQQLQRQNQDLLARLSAVEHKTHGSELARIDKAIEDQHVRIQYAKMKMSEAASSQDGEGMANAQEMWFEARRAAESLENLKNQASTPRNQAIAPDRNVQKMAAKWMESNDWYDPSGSDEDSEIALTVDKRMVKEGWNPADADYWEELDARLQKRLPHRYNDDTSNDIRNETVTRRPKSVVTSSGRESVSSSGGRTSFTLSSEQVKAMKDAGMWDDPEKRARMVRRYAQEQRSRSN
jgi:hypothetical protein